jgi:hypothetical protein
VAAVQFQNPFGGVVEEVAIMGNRHHSAGEAVQELLQPVHRFGVQVVGWFVQQQHVGFGQQQLAQRHAALFTAGQHADDGIPWRQAQRIGGHFQLLVQAVAIGGRNDGFQARLLGRQCIEIGIFFGIGGIDSIQLGLRFKDFAQRAFDFLAHGLGGIQLRFLRQIADIQVRHRHGFAFDILVHASHDLEQGRLARAVQTEHADLGTREERQRNVLQNLAFRRHDLADAVHSKYVLSHVN